MSQFVDNVERLFIAVELPEVVLIRMERFYTMEKYVIRVTVYQYGKEVGE